jgi:hypothetical protein
VALLNTPGLAAASLAAGFPTSHGPLGHAFAEGRSPVLFAEMPLDNARLTNTRPAPPPQAFPAARNFTAIETT